jgi:hypothetical protein
MIDTFRFDEDKYPFSWVFNDKDCVLSDDEKSKIVLLGINESSGLWDMFFPFKSLYSIRDGVLYIPVECFVELDYTHLDVDDPDNFDECIDYFTERLKGVDVVFFFWSRECAAILPKPIFLKTLPDFLYYTACENSILLAPNSNLIIYGDRSFFFGKLVKPLA